MKRPLKTLSIVLSLFFVSLCISNCNSEQETIESQEQSLYQCPMDCEAGKTYKEPGACAICGMPVKLVTEESIP